MVAACHACGREFLNSRGLTHHFRHCREIINWESQLQHRLDHLEDEDLSQAAKRARIGSPVNLEHEQPSILDDGTESGPSLSGVYSGHLDVPPSASGPPASFSLSGRRRKVPRALKDYLPHSLAGLGAHLRPAAPASLTPKPSEPQPPSLEPTPEPEPEPGMLVTTDTNGFGLYREYTRAPIVDPEDNTTLEDLCSLTETPQESNTGTDTAFFHPFLNASVFRLLDWFYSGSATKSKADLDSLVHNVILAEDFKLEDVKHFSADREMARLDEYGNTGSPFLAKDGWKEGSVKIRVPNAKSKFASESVAPEFDIGGVYYRPLLEIIKGAYQSPDAKKYHWVPFKLFHQSSQTHAPVRVYTDIYNSDAMLEEDAKIHALPRDPGDNPDTEVAIAPILVWSDSTHLASFGTASLWPIYIFFGNLSKYLRGKPTALAAHHLAYIPSVRFMLIN
jgi:hypothetical protein